MRTRLKSGTIERARDLRLKMTDTERKLWYKLRELNTQGYHFRRQAPFRFYILDFAEHGAKLAIELDGSQHGLEDQSRKDRKRDELLAGEGYLVLRIWNSDLNENLDGVVEMIVRELQGRAPAPHPPRSALRAPPRRPPHKGEVKRTLPRKGLRAPASPQRGR